MSKTLRSEVLALAMDLFSSKTSVILLPQAPIILVFHRPPSTGYGCTLTTSHNKELVFSSELSGVWNSRNEYIDCPTDKQSRIHSFQALFRRD